MVFYLILMNLGTLQLFLKSRKVNRSLEHLTSVQVRCFCMLFIFAAVSNVFLSQNLRNKFHCWILSRSNTSYSVLCSYLQVGVVLVDGRFICTSCNGVQLPWCTADKETIVADAEMPVSSVIETDSSDLITKDGNEVAVEGEQRHC